ncbi:hypothetical protein lerEdw1_007933, partial [Lerista edwardsae]
LQTELLSLTCELSFPLPLCSKMSASVITFNIDAPRWDQNTFWGRVKHFFNITDPRTLLVSEHELDSAKALVESCRAGMVPPGTSQEQLFYAKKLYDSAFHPDSGEKMNLIGRMSFQVPGGMAITGFMLQYYRTVPAVVFWQWVNQSFNAIVNYTNRNAANPISLKQIGVAYVTATSTALATAVGLNLYTKVFSVKYYASRLQAWEEENGNMGSSGLTLNCIIYLCTESSIPCGPLGSLCSSSCCQLCEYSLDEAAHLLEKAKFRNFISPQIYLKVSSAELINGVMVMDENDNPLGESRKAAIKGITEVVVSRITMAAPGMILLPIVMERLEKYPFMKKIQVLHAPLQTVFVGVLLVFMVPIACALFPQRRSGYAEMPYATCRLQTMLPFFLSSSIAFLRLEPDLQASIIAKHGDKVPYVYFNKGL